MRVSGRTQICIFKRLRVGTYVLACVLDVRTDVCGRILGVLIRVCMDAYARVAEILKNCMYE